MDNSYNIKCSMRFLLIHHLSVSIQNLGFPAVDPLWPPFVRYFPNGEAAVCASCE